MELEVLRLFVPRNKLINDNAGQHYKTHMGKTKWLTNQAKLEIEGFIQPCDFKVPDLETVHKIVFDADGKCRFKIITEHWKCQQTFDLSNYDMTFKPLIDSLTAVGYWKDDSWKYVWPFVYSGGDYSVWNERAIRFEGDGLPDNIKKDWWLQNGMNPVGDSFVRIIISDDLRL